MVRSWAAGGCDRRWVLVGEAVQGRVREVKGRGWSWRHASYSWYRVCRPLSLRLVHGSLHLRRG